MESQSNPNPFAMRTGQSSAPLVTNSPSQRHSLSSSPQQAKQPAPSHDAGTDGLAPHRITVGGASSSSSSARVSRNQSHTESPDLPRYLSLSEAFRIAEREEEEAMKGSPSPAPRSWRGPGPSSSGDKKHQKTVSQGALASSGLDHKKTKKRSQLDFNKDESASSADTLGAKSDMSVGSDIDRKLSEFARKQGVTSGSPKLGSGLLSRTKFGPKMVEKGKEVIRKAQSASQDSNAQNGESSKSKAKQDGGWLDRKLSRKSKAGNSSSPQNGGHSGDVPMERSSTVPPDYPSRTPNKSYLWDAEADFTAGDVQASNSPPVNIARTNTKLDEIAALEVEVLRRFPERNSLSPPSARTNTKLVEIEEREADALLRFPVRTSSSLASKIGRTNTKLNEIQALESEASQRFPRVFMSPTGQDLTDGSTTTTRPTRLQEMSALEKEAAERFPGEPPLGLVDMLADLHAVNKGKEHASRDVQQSRQLVAKSDPLRAREMEILSRKALATARLDELGERVPENLKRSSKESSDDKTKDSPGGSGNMTSTGVASIHDKEEAVLDTTRTRNSSRDIKLPSIEKAEGDGGKSVPIPDGLGQPARKDPRDFLRQLARATSNSPASEDQGAPDGNLGAKPNQAAVARDELRPTVGFVGLRSPPSSDSLASKRSTAEADPTDRIEGELKLFAPAENHSEKGSLRASSPDLYEDGNHDEAEVTPRPPKSDPMTQPTPIVTGAYVDTPVTVKVEKAGELLVPEQTRQGQTAAAVEPKDLKGIQANGLSMAVSSVLRGRKPNSSRRKLKQTLSAKGDRVGSGSLVVSAFDRRTRSVPRAKSPLINSAKPPTARDDLLEIQRLHHIEDSTLDEFGDLLGSPASPDTGLKVEEDDKDSILDGKKELETYDKMSKSLKTGLLEIRTAKQGIERLEDKVSHVERKPKADAADAKNGHTREYHAHEYHAHEDNVTHYYYIPLTLPRLWHRQPRFRLTLLGLILLLLSLWSVAESITCGLYCKPRSCYSGKPCDWSPEDPFWGHALPVKVDQWIAGGAGRRLANRVGPDVADWLADVWDAATGTDITKVDTSNYGWHQRRQHRRRLLKRGLGGAAKSFVARPEDRDKFAAWRAARLARERVESAREMGFEMGDDEESMGADETLR